MFVPLAIVACSMSAPVPEAPKPEPAWMKAFRANYELKPDEYVKRVAPPYIPERVEFYLGAYGPPKYPESDVKNRASYKEHSKWFTIFVEQIGRKLKQRMTLSSAYLASEVNLQRGDNVLSVSDAVESITGMSTPEFIIDPKHLNDPLFDAKNLTVHGDFVVRKNAPIELLAAQLETILRKECKVPVRLRVDQVEQEVFVVSGEFKLQPPKWRLEDTPDRQKKLIDIYATEAGLNPTYDHFDFQKQQQYKGRAISSQYSGNSQDFVRAVGFRVEKRMVWDWELPSDPNFSWCQHTISNPNMQEAADDCDPELILKNVSTQTGLKFHMEKRKVSVLVISPE